MDLYLELEQKQDELTKAIKELRSAGSAYAEADTTYRRLVAQESLRLKAQGMAISLIDKAVFDSEQVADALFQKDITEVMIVACKEEINALKLRIKLISEQLAREYGR